MYEITITVSYKEVEKAIQSLQSIDIFNIYYQQPIEIDTDENGYTYKEKEDEKVNVKAFIELDTNELDNVVGAIKNVIENIFDIAVKKVEEDNWQQPFNAIDLNNGWVIGDISYNEGEKRKIIFEPQGAFGTGLHETTQDCLKIILEENYENKTVLDLGTGSGILSIAASIRNAKSVIGIDIEDVKEQVEYNASLNNIKNIKVKQINVLKDDFKLENKFDEIFVNIGAEETLSLMPFIESHLKVNGRLLVSGLVEWNYEKVTKKLQSIGYTIDKMITTNEWITILLDKTNHK